MASERQQLEQSSPWWGEHVHRYETVLPYVAESAIVLDIACGTGFGADILARQAANVIGADIDLEAIQTCRKSWNRENLEFRCIDGTDLPFPDNHFDVITSFETIEHTTKYDAMVAELRRVLKSDGKCLISTPNFVVNSPSGIVTNPYHTQEFVYDELEEILNQHFSDVKIHGQLYTRYIGSNRKSEIGKRVETLLYKRGVRKIPIAIQDKLMRGVVSKKMYPDSSDFDMISERSEVEKCKTFFALCKK